MGSLGAAVEVQSLDDLDVNLHKTTEHVSQSDARVIVLNNGIPVAVLISVADLEELRRLETDRNLDFSVIDEIRNTFKDILAEEIEEEAARTIQEARAELRAKTDSARSHHG